MFNGDILEGRGRIMSMLFWKIFFLSICHLLVAWCVVFLHDYSHICCFSFCHKTFFLASRMWCPSTWRHEANTCKLSIFEERELTNKYWKERCLLGKVILSWICLILLFSVYWWFVCGHRDKMWRVQGILVTLLVCKGWRGMRQLWGRDASPLVDNYQWSVSAGDIIMICPMIRR